MEMTVERARRGDPAAFEQLYREHSRWVYALARRLADDDAEASDMTQDVFIRLWQKLDTFRGDAEFRGWLRKLAVNVCLNRMSDERRRIERVFTTEDPSLFETGGNTKAHETGIDLDRAIRQLPKHARTVFVLTEVEGYKQREVAEMTGVAEGTVKAQLHRARKLLQAALNR
jgi:RNA polymerase sigma-70 factor (ECF subfamily)